MRSLVITLVILLFSLSPVAAADVVDTLKGSTDFKDGFLDAGAPANNAGGHTLWITGYQQSNGTNTRNEYIWFNLPSHADLTNVACTLAFVVSTDAGNDSVDIKYSTRDVSGYVGDNAYTTADSSEMNWTNYFEGGSGVDSAWTTAGGDWGSDIIGTAIVTGTGTFKVELDSTFIDSILNTSKDNNGFFVLTRDRATNNDHEKRMRSTEYATVGDRPFVIIAYDSAAAATTTQSRRRRILSGGR